MFFCTKHNKKIVCSDSAGSDWLSLTDTRQVKFKEQITSSYFSLYELSVFKLAEEASTATPIKNTRKWFVPWTWPDRNLVDSSHIDVTVQIS